MSKKDWQDPPIPFQLRDPKLLRDLALVGGEWVSAQSGARFDIIDPGTEQKWISCPDNAAEDVDAAVKSAQAAFELYRKMTPRQRAKILMRWHDLMLENKNDLGTILTFESGKPLAEAIGEVEYSASYVWWFVGEAERIQGTTSFAALPGRRIMTTKQPLGVTVALVPWNFPLASLLRKVGAALAAGCTMICKPSPETPITTLALADLAQQAGFGPGVFSVLTTSLENTPALSEALCLHPLVKKVSFTGSTRVGKIVASLCARGVKKVSLELGGNCPFIVFDDANLDQAADALTTLKWKHAGQACITANRIFVHSAVYDKFIRLLDYRTESLKMGHGYYDSNANIGPVTTSRSMVTIQAQVDDAISLGAALIRGGKRAGGRQGGFFYEPTILGDMQSSMKASQEEIFGPVAAVYKFETEAEVTDLANDTSMGLAAYCFTKDVDRIWRMWENLESGMVGLNTGNSSAAESPFGGMKDSGYGKEGGKDVSINEYLVTKTGTVTLENHY